MTQHADLEAPTPRVQIIEAIQLALQAIPGAEVEDTHMGWKIVLGGEDTFVEVL